MSDAEKFMGIFRGYELRHGRYKIIRHEQSGKLSGHAKTVDACPTLQDYQDHIDGKTGIGIIPLTNTNKCYFAAIDVDVYPVDINDIVWRVRRLPVFVTRSKSGGAHIWLFIPKGVDAIEAITVMKSWAGELV